MRLQERLCEGHRKVLRWEGSAATLKGAFAGEGLCGDPGGGLARRLRRGGPDEPAHWAPYLTVTVAACANVAAAGTHTRQVCAAPKCRAGASSQNPRSRACPTRRPSRVGGLVRKRGRCGYPHPTGLRSAGIPDWGAFTKAQVRGLPARGAPRARGASCANVAAAGTHTRQVCAESKCRAEARAEV